MFSKRSFFYGWMIVAIAFVSMPFIYGTKNSFAVFFASLLREYPWSRANTAIMYSLHNLVYGLLAPLAGSLGDRWNPQRIMAIGVIVLSLAAGACAFAYKLWHFYLLFGLMMPIGTVFCGWPLLAPALTNWFIKNRGFVLGLGQMGGGLSFAYNLFAEYLIQQFGRRPAYLVLGVTLIALVLPLYIFLFHYRPESRGLKAYGALELREGKGLSGKTGKKGDLGASGWPLRKAIKTYQLWFLIISYFLYWGVGCFLVLAHQVKYVEDIGFTSAFGASILALIGIFITAGQLSAFLSDRIGREKTMSLAAVLTISALLVIIPIRDTSRPWLFHFYAICFGYGAGLYGPTIFAAAADIFYGRQFGGIAGFLLAGMGLGGAIGPWIGGYLYDVMGSYRPAFFLCIVCFAASLLCVWIAAPRHAQGRQSNLGR